MGGLTEAPRPGREARLARRRAWQASCVRRRVPDHLAHTLTVAALGALLLHEMLAGLLLAVWLATLTLLGAAEAWLARRAFAEVGETPAAGIEPLLAARLAAAIGSGLVLLSAALSGAVLAQAFATLLAVAFAVSAAATLAAAFTAFAAVVLASSVPLAAALLLSSVPVSRALGTLLALAIVLTLVAGWRYARAIEEGLRLRGENVELAGVIRALQRRLAQDDARGAAEPNR